MKAIEDGIRRILFTQATGCGKTSTAAEIVRLVLEKQHRVLLIAHRTELIEQMYGRVKDHCDLAEWEIGTEIGSWRADGCNKVIVGSVQTCYRPHRLPEGWKPEVIITDECHRSPAKSFKTIY